VRRALAALASSAAQDTDETPSPTHPGHARSAPAHTNAIVPFYGVYDWTNRFGFRPKSSDLTVVLERSIVKRRFEDARDVYELASPLSHVREDAPPALVVHGALDRLAPVEEARAFVDALRAVSTEPVVYVELPGTHHAFEVFQSVRALHTVAAVERFLTWVSTTRTGG